MGGVVMNKTLDLYLLIIILNMNQIYHMVRKI